MPKAVSATALTCAWLSCGIRLYYIDANSGCPLRSFSRQGRKYTREAHCSRAPSGTPAPTTWSPKSAVSVFGILAVFGCRAVSSDAPLICSLFPNELRAGICRQGGRLPLAEVKRGLCSVCPLPCRGSPGAVRPVATMPIMLLAPWPSPTFSLCASLPICTYPTGSRCGVV